MPAEQWLVFLFHYKVCGLMVFIADTQLNPTIKWNSDQRFNIVLGKHINIAM